MFESNSARVKNKIKDQFSKNISESAINIISIIMQVILAIIQIIGIPILYPDIMSYSSQFILTQVIVGICCTLCILLHVFGSQIYQIDLRTPELETYLLSNEKLSPAMFKAARIIEQEEEQDIELILGSNNTQDLVKAAFLNPSQFYSDQSDLISIHLQLILSPVLTVDNAQELKKTITQSVYEKVEKIIEEDGGKEKFFKFMKKSSEKIKSELSQLKINDDQKITYNYTYLKEMNEEFFAKCREYVINFQKNKTHFEDLKKIENYSSSDKADNYYQKTFSSKIVELIESSGIQDSEVDKVLLNWYQSTLYVNNQTPVPIKIEKKGKYPKICGNDILSMIEFNCCISRKVINNTNNDSKAFRTTLAKDSMYPSDVTYTTYILPDRSVIDLTNEIAYLSEFANMTEIPQFYKLVFDSKKAQLVFENEQELFQFIKALRKPFGDDMKKELKVETSDAKIRVAQISNSFNPDKDQMSIVDFQKAQHCNQTKKINIVFEVQYTVYNYSIKMEITCITIDEVGFLECDQVIDEWETSFHNYNHLKTQEKEFIYYENIANQSTIFWRILQLILIIILFPTLIFTVIEVRELLQLSPDECMTAGNPYDLLLNQCNNHFVDMNPTQQYYQCNKYQEVDSVYTMCIKNPIIYYDICMSQDYETFGTKKACTSSWTELQMNQENQAQYNQCKKFHFYESISNICLLIDGVYQNVCMSEGRSSLSTQCQHYFEENQETMIPLDQIEFCGRFKAIFSVVSICETLKEVFFTVCMLSDNNSFSQECVNFFISGYNEFDEFEKYLICNKQESNDIVKQTCLGNVDIQYHFCQREEELSDGCLLWFQNDWDTLLDIQQQVQCQMQQTSPDIASICINIPSMVNQLYQICMTLDQNEENIKCATQLERNQAARTDVEVIELCQKYNEMLEMNTLCWNLYEKPIKFALNGQSDNICMITLAKVNCLNNSTRVKQFNDLLPVDDIDMIGNSVIVRTEENQIQTSIESDVQGQHFQDNYDQFEVKFANVQMTDDQIITQGDPYSLFKTSDTEQYFEQTQDMSKRRIMASGNSVCGFSTNEIMCDAPFDNIGLTDIPEQLTTESVIFGEGNANHQCVITMAGRPLCWGANENGQQSFPALLDADNSITYLWTASRSTCALDTNLEIICWGYNGNGETDFPSEVANEPLLMGSGGSTMMCAVVIAEGANQCWGLNQWGAVDPPAAQQTGVVLVSTGQQHSCALNQSLTAGCWGETETVPEAFSNVPVLKISSGIERYCMQRVDDLQAQCIQQLFEIEQEMPGQPVDIVAKQTRYQSLNATGGITGNFWSPSFIIELTEDLEGEGRLNNYPLELSNVSHSSIGPNKEICVNNVVEGGVFKCSGVPVVEEGCVETESNPCSSINPNLIQPIILPVVPKNTLCVIDSHICQVSSNDMQMSTAECVSPLDLNTIIYSISHADQMIDDALKEITQLHCGKTRMCVRFADETVECVGMEHSGGYMENTIALELNSGVMEVMAGNGFTCMMQKNFTTKCNGMYNGDDGMAMVFTIHDTPIDQES